MQNNNSGFQTYKRLLLTAKPYWIFFLLGIVGTISLSMTDVSLVWLVKPIINHAFVKRDRVFIHWLPIVIFVIFIFRGVTSFSSTYFVTRVARTVVRDLRRFIFAKLLRLPAAYYDHHNSGHILSTIVYNVEQVAQASSDALLTCIRESSLAVGLVVAMFMTDWRLSLLFLVIAPLLAWVVKWSSVRMRRLSGNVQRSVGDVTQVAGEGIEGYRVIRLHGGQQYEIQKFQEATKSNLQRELKVTVTNSIGTSLMQLVLAIPIAITLLVATNPALGISPGAFGSIVTAMIMLLRPVRRISAVNTDIQKGIAAADSIFQLLDESVEQDTGKIKTKRVDGNIAFDNVVFEYQRTHQRVLDEISFSVQAGKTVAIVGKSGSGKSTIANLLPRFYEIAAGKITLDKIDIRDYELINLRQQFAFVSQDTVLFDDTIANNIAYGCIDATRKDIERVAQAAHAVEFIAAMPKGFDTQIGEDGVLLSGGQRQRIAIARALLKNAPILILDEATASLDVHAERHIQAALDDLMRDRTVLVIAHRLSTVEKADNIIVLEKGSIVETGTHTTLLEKNGAYATLYRSQFIEESATLERV